MSDQNLSDQKTRRKASLHTTTCPPSLLSLPISRHVSALELRTYVNTSIGTSLPSCPFKILYFSSDWFATVSVAQWLFFQGSNRFPAFWCPGALLWIGTLHQEPQQTFWAEVFVLPDRPHKIRDRPWPCSAFTCHLLNWKVKTHLTGWYDSRWRQSETMYRSVSCFLILTGAFRFWVFIFLLNLCRASVLCF